MTFKRRLLAYSAAAAIAATVSQGLVAEEVRLDYVGHPLESEIAKELWGDVLDSAFQTGELVPEVFVATYKNPAGEDLRITMLGAMSVCGLNECPIRIYRGDEKVADFNGCQNTEKHALNSTGSIFIACDDLFSIPSDGR